MEMIISDEKGTRFQATILPKDVSKHKDWIKEGDWKTFEWFQVSDDFKFGLKPSPSTLKIEFLPHTIVGPSEPFCEGLMLQPYRFFDIIDHVHESNDLIDVVGVLHHMEELREVQMRNSKSVITNLRFELINPERDIVIPCVAREALARQIYHEVKQNKANHIVCALRFWTVSEGRGSGAHSVELSCTTLSEFMVNPLDSETEEVLSKFLLAK